MIATAAHAILEPTQHSRSQRPSSKGSAPLVGCSHSKTSHKRGSHCPEGTRWHFRPVAACVGLADSAYLLHTWIMSTAQASVHMPYNKHDQSQVCMENT
eukprot:1158789-Pelagomonas_calceolata.AAC.7